MGLIFLREGFEQGGIRKPSFLFFRKRLCHCIELLDRWIQIKIQCWRDAELGERVLDCRLDKCIHDFFILELDFLFCRVNVDVQFCRIKVYKKNIQWETVRGYHLLESAHYRMVQVGAPDKPVIDKQVLIPARFFGCFRLADESAYVQVGCPFVDRNKLGVQVVAEQLDDPLFERSFFEVKQLLAVTGHGKENPGKSQCNANKFIQNVTHFRSIALQEISSCGNVEKQIFHGDTRAR